MADIVFVHGMFQTASSWDRWIERFAAKGFPATAVIWPLHDGDPRDLRGNPPAGLGELTLRDVIASIEEQIGDSRPIMIGHSVGGLIVQTLLNRDLISAAVVVASVAPNAMLELDWGFIKFSAGIANPLKGDDPILMNLRAFHATFANTLNEGEALHAFENTANHDSRNVLRDCMGPDGMVDLDAPHAPLLLIGGEKDEIIPASLVEKNFRAYTHQDSLSEMRIFPGRSHYICNEAGWEEVADYALGFIERNATPTGAHIVAQDMAQPVRTI